MLNFILIKKNDRNEFRFYTENQEEIEGKILYKGHRLGISEKLLSSLLDFKLERMNKTIYLKNYETDNWFIGRESDVTNMVNKSYETLQSKAEKEFGKFRKIVITAI